MRRVFAIAGLFILGAALVFIAAAGPFMSRVESPAYTIDSRDGAIEVRTYPPMVVATVHIDGDRGVAVNRGFRLLANYIFGANSSEAKIAMTAPVMQNRRDASSASGTWTVRFVMPRDWTKDRLPRPRDERVTLESMSAATFAVVRFSGFWRDAVLARMTAELSAWVAHHGRTPRGQAIYAFYNPPWTLPMFRRNEVMIEVAPTSGRTQ